MFSDISFGFATQMLELAHRLTVDLRLSTAGPRSGLRPGNTDQPGCKFIQELESGGGLEYLIFHPTHYRTGALLLLARLLRSPLSLPPYSPPPLNFYLFSK